LIRIALDAMGGDNAPEVILDGAVRFAQAQGHAQGADAENAVHLHLLGPETVVREGLAKRGADPKQFTVVDAPDVLTYTDSPVEAMRKKPRNSILLGIGLVKEKRADAFVSAGSTGVVVAAATVGLRCLEGIRRPGIAVTIQGEGGPFVVIDVGANPQPKPQHLLHYALMGSAYHVGAFGTATPRVGLMNIGSEEGKGNPLAKETSQLLKDAPINFAGNIEGVDVFRGVCDVIVCDGFTGNVLLKASEGCAEYMLRTITKLMEQAKIAPESRKAVLLGLHERVDYSEYGGALLLGVEGIVTICHGRSDARAISNALKFAGQAVGARVNEHIVAAAKAASATS
jgi:glycerol-3-phosphate acyltransferase PlsX